MHYKLQLIFNLNAQHICLIIKYQKEGIIINIFLISLLKSETDEEASIDKKKKNSLELELS